MRTSTLLLQFGLAATAAAQILPPSWGVVQHSGNQAVEIQGLPGSWLAVPASLGPVDAVASSPSQICWTRDGSLNIRNRQTGATRTVPAPAGPARFAFDSHGALAAVWFTASGQLYTAAAGWAPVLSIPPAASQLLDLSNPTPGSVELLLRSAGGGRRTAAEAASDRPRSRIQVPVRPSAVPDLQLRVIDTLTGETRTGTALADRSGPAALDSAGDVVFAADAGLPTVDSIQHLDRGWLLLTAASHQYAWKLGMRPQATTDTTTAVLRVQGQPAPLCNTDGNSCTITMQDTPAGSVYSTTGYYLANNSSTSSICVISNTGFIDPNTNLLDSFFADRIEEASGSYISFHSVPFGMPAQAIPYELALPIQFSPQDQTKHTATLTLGYYLSGDTTGNTCNQATLPSGATLFNLAITVTGTGTTPPPGPVLNSLSPDSNQSGAPSFSLTVYGGGFESDSQVLWGVEMPDGTNKEIPLATVYVSATQLSASVPGSLLTAVGAATVTVNNPTSNAGVSQGMVFLILGIPSTFQPTLVLDQTSPMSNTQVKVSVTFDQNAPSGGLTGGLLTLTFTPAPNLADDPSIFLDGNLQQTRAQPFTVPAGSNVANFGTQTFVTLNTGTTAGAFTLTAALGAQSAQWGPYAIAPAAPAIASSTLGASATGVQVILQGFDNSQATSGLTFEFYATDGSAVSPGLITMNGTDLTSGFSTYYKANTLLAGKFQVTATFPVSGDITKIAKVNVTLSNPSGTASATVPVQ